MSKDNYDNPIANAVLVFVLLGGLYQCAAETWVKVEPGVTGFFNGVGIVLGYYFIPFVGASLVVGFILAQLCMAPRQWGGSPIDFRFAALGISLICSVVLISLGIPKVETTWMISMWAGLLFGGPLRFWCLAKRLLPIEERRLKALATKPLLEQLEELKTALTQEESRNYRLSSQLKDLQAEAEKLQKRDKFLSKKEKDESGEKTTHILDSNDGFWRGRD